MKAELIDFMGDDIRVANAARVSFDKETWWSNEEDWLEFDTPLKLGESDQKLIKYLAKHNHWTPFSHVQLTMRETVPIFVARQRFKHMVGFTYNEVSRRYVDDTPEFFTPATWRSRPSGSVKQGSGTEEITEPKIYIPCATDFGYEDIIGFCKEWYEAAIKAGIAPEQARMVLPQSMYTSYYVTGSLAAWSRAYKLRIDPHAQLEIQDLAKVWGSVIGSIEELKYSWEALTSEA